jgi:hypothetical protein
MVIAYVVLCGQAATGIGISKGYSNGIGWMAMTYCSYAVSFCRLAETTRRGHQKEQCKMSCPCPVVMYLMSKRPTQLDSSDTYPM